MQLSEANMATAQQVGQFGSWELDLGNRVDINANPLRWSDETFRIFGYAPGSVPVTNDLFFHAVPPDEREAIQQTIAEAIAGHDPYSCVHRVCRPDGEERTVRETARFFESDGQGKPARLVGTVHDITDRIRVEEALERTNREILATWESMTDGFFAIDTNWQFTHINSQGAQLLSTTREKVIGVSIWDAFPEAVNTTISYREYHRALEEQVSVGFEEFYAPLGKWFEVRAYPSSVGLSVYFHDITERKQSEAALNDSEREHLLLIRRLEEKSASLAEAQAIAKVGSWELDLGTRAVTWSDETFRIFGVKPEDFRGTSESVKESVHPEDLPMIRKAFADSISDRTPCSLDHRLLMRDGTIKFVHERCITYYDNDGRPIRSVGTTQDITTRKEAEAERDMIEKALRQSRNQFRSVVETVESLFISDHQGRIVDVNQNACDSLGYTREEMLHLRVPDFELNADPETFDLNWQRMASGDRKPFLVDGVEKRKDGSTFPVEVRIGMLETEGNLQVVAVARDITDRKKAEEERDRFFTLSLDMLAIVSSDGYFKRLNPAFEATLGYTDAEFMSKPLLEYIHPDDVASTQVQMTNFGRGIEDVSFDNRYRCSDGSYKWLRWAAAPFKDLWYCVAHDITEEMHAAEALHDANERLELRVIERTAQLENSNREMGIAREEADRANEAKSDFLSRMSHELRTPLNGILGFAQLMEMDTPSPKQAVRLGHILKSGQHLLQLINEVLDLARAESGRLHLSAEPVSLGDSVQGAVDIIRPLAEKRNQQILFDWYTSEPLYVHADQQRLSQVLL
ncbi:MAG: PAS domain S-box protein, partial [Chthonomonadales bacterium]